MITVDRVCGTDLFSYESLDIRLTNRGLVIVEGCNGAGKTSIFDTLLWTLYGKSTKKLLADDVIREDRNHKPIKGKTRGYVCLYKDEDKIEVFRHRAHKEYEHKLVLCVNDVDVTLGTNPETQNRLDGLLGMDYDTFINAVVFPQDADGFVSLTDAQQKSILDRIIDTNRFVRAREYNKKILDINKDSLARCSSLIFELTTNLQNAKADEKRISQEQDSWMRQLALDLRGCTEELTILNDNQPTMDSDLEDRILDALELISQDRFLGIQKKAREVSQDITDLKTKMAGYDAEIKFLTQRGGDRPTAEVPKPDIAGDMDGVKQTVLLLRAQITNAEAEVNVRQKDLVSIIDSMEKYDGTCPLCGAKADPLAEAKLIGDSKKTQSDIELSLIGLRKNIQSWKIELEKNINFEKEIDNWVNYLAKIEVFKQIDEIEDSRASLQLAVLESEDERSAIDLEYKALLDKRQDYDKLCAIRDAQHKLISEHALHVAQAASRLKETQNRVSPHSSQLTELRSRNTAAKRRIQALEDWHGTISRQVEAGLYWDRGFGNQGVKSLIYSHVFPVLTERANEYLVILADGLASVDFSSQTKLGSGEVREKIEAKVSLVDGGDSYNKGSGGEQKKVDLASMFSLGDLSAERTQSRVNLRLLDEPFDSLDRDGAERVVRALEELVVPNAKTVLVMSHSDHIKSLIPQRIQVVKHNGVSQLIQN